MSSSYDLDAELRGMQRRLEKGIERNYLRGIARLEGRDPEEYVAEVETQRAVDGLKHVGNQFRLMSQALSEALDKVVQAWHQAAAQAREELENPDTRQAN